MAQKRKNKMNNVKGEVCYSSTAVRRTNRRVWLILPGVFVAVFLFTFLVAKFKDNNTADAANLGAFDPGYIISDYQMSNYNSMSEADIQNFLKQKGNCNDTRTYLADYYTNYSYHIRDGHFVCLADETFGDGTAYGNSAPNGASAAHIIWQAAQDYRINPQVIIVLLQKEQGLITDSWPNNRQYRSATGYGCPDTAACDSKYYGFKNQVRQAAAMFRTVLDGGWTNYPLGSNYIQYNPDSSCGGSWVNIRSLATSALYRYTPYQPNASALAAGYGSGDSCGAYGNRNFYLYFEDWFGRITDEELWYKMETPRYLTTNIETKYYNPSTSSYTNETISSSMIAYYSTKTVVKDGRMCLRTEQDEKNKINRCVLYDELTVVDWSWGSMETPRYMKSGLSSEVIDLTTRRKVANTREYEYYDSRVGLPNGDMCLRIKGQSGNNCVLYSSLKEANYEISKMQEPRYLVATRSEAKVWDPVKNIQVGTINGDKIFYNKKINLPNGGGMCLMVSGSSKYACVKYEDLGETWVEMERPREMVMNRQSYKVNALDLSTSYDITLIVGMRRMFVRKRFMRDNNWCLQTEYDADRGTDYCIRYNELSEI